MSHDVSTSVSTPSVQRRLRTSNNYITWTIESNVHPRNPLNPLSQQNSFSNFLLALRRDTLIGYKRRQETHRQPSYPQRSLPLVVCRSASKAKYIAREVFWNARNFNCAQPPLPSVHASLVPRPHPLRGKGSGDISWLCWISRRVICTCVCA